VLLLRYGGPLPDDDAGREEGHELLLLQSLHPTHPVERMRGEIKVWLPWMQGEEGERVIDNILVLPLPRRWSTRKELGERMRLTDRERTAAKAWSILPVDITEEELKERAKERARWRRKERQRDQGVKPRIIWQQQNPEAKTEPWKALGVSRATFYRRKAAGLLASETGHVAVILLLSTPTAPVSPPVSPLQLPAGKCDLAPPPNVIDIAPLCLRRGSRLTAAARPVSKRKGKR